MFPYTESMVKNFLENSIGFDSLLYSIKEQTNQYPPYDIIKLDDLSYEIKLALAGFSKEDISVIQEKNTVCLLYTSPSPRDVEESRMPSSA